MKIKNPLRLTLIVICILWLSVTIILKIIDTISAEEYAEIAHLTEEVVPANRGNIYAYNDELLAVTSFKYDVRFDPVYARTLVTNKDLEMLANDLSKIFNNKTEKQYFTYLSNGIQNRYLLLKRNASFEQVERLKNSNYYKKYKKHLRGGLRIEEHTSRQKPNANSAARTIGDLYKDNTPKYGLEYSYNSKLMGEDGKYVFLEEPGVGKRKINDSNNIEPNSGKDLITTIDLGFQDILEESLLRQLEKHEANFGTAILMEVKTGQIKAITNLKKTEKGKYAEILNFGVSRQIEPGSTMKLASIMAYLEDHNGSLEDTIDCKNGKFRFKGATIETRDSKKLGQVSIKEAFAYSSNIGIGRLIKKYYKHEPQKFINRLYNFGLGKKSKIDLSGVPPPKLLSPSDESWSGIALHWTSFGYGILLTPLDILTFYNAVANNGYLVNPYLGYAFREGSELVKIPRNQISYTICSELTIEKIKILLREVVKNGTAKKLNNLPFSVSGKTGTTVKNYMTHSVNQEKEYQSSFVGFFPSEDPKFSCIVLVDSPNIKIGYYGSDVAMPVFQEIAYKIYIKNGLEWRERLDYSEKKSRTSLNNSIEVLDSLFTTIKTVKGQYPNVVGMHVRDAIFLLESKGYQVNIQGDFGNVRKQYPKANSVVNKQLAITLFI